jgi:hypothetical protein
VPSLSVQQSEASPSPEAVHLCQSGFTHPKKLIFDGREPIFGVIVASTDQIEELPMKFRCRRGDNLEIDEQPVDGELLGNLTERSTFAFVLKVMNGEPSDHHIEGPKRCQWVLQIPLSNADPLVAPESIFGTAEHGWRRIQGYHALHTVAMLEYEGGQPAVAATQVEHRAW